MSSNGFYMSNGHNMSPKIFLYKVIVGVHVYFAKNSFIMYCLQ